jgi:predicted aspartyl protease
MIASFFRIICLLLSGLLRLGSVVLLVLTALVIPAAPIHAQIHPVRQPIATVRDLRLFTAPDESSQQIEVPKSDASLLPLAETNSDGSKWYLVKTRNGMTGWIKGGPTDEAQKLDAFFRNLRSGSLSDLPVEIQSPTEQPMSSSPIKVPIRMNGAAAFVSVMLNHTIRAEMLLDTGATYTLVARRIATGLRLYESARATLSTANGLITVPLARMQSIKVGAAEALNLTVAIQDASMNSAIDGLLGLDFLSRFHTSIDSRQQLLILAPR